MRKFILFLIRRRFGLKKWQGFQFAGQKSKDNWYFFGKDYIWKVSPHSKEFFKPSNVSLNWLLNDACDIKLHNVICVPFDEHQVNK